MARNPRLRSSLFERLIAFFVSSVSILMICWVIYDVFLSPSQPSGAVAAQVFQLDATTKPLIVDRAQSEATAVAAERTEPEIMPVMASEDKISLVEPSPIDPATQQEIQSLETALKSANEKIGALEGQLATVSAEREKERQTAEIELAHLTEVNAELTLQADQLSAEVASLKGQLNEAQTRAQRSANKLRTIESQERQAAEKAETAAEKLARGKEAYQNERFAEAETIWKELLEEGDARAQFHLGALYFEGKSGTIDLPAAYKLLSKAIEGGFGPALAMRERVRSAMTSEEIASVRN